MHLASLLNCTGIPLIPFDALHSRNFVRTWHRTRWLTQAHRKEDVLLRVFPIGCDLVKIKVDGESGLDPQPHEFSQVIFPLAVALSCALISVLCTLSGSHGLVHSFAFGRFAPLHRLLSGLALCTGPKTTADAMENTQENYSWTFPCWETTARSH